MDAMVAPSFGAPGFYARKQTWESESIPDDLSQNTFVVTGANSGIGYAATRELAGRGATVYMACRNKERGETARQTLQDEVSGKLVLKLVDVSSLASVKAFATSLRGTPFDGLIHNAGALVHERTITDDDLELTFACHVAGPMLANEILRETLDQNGARVIFVSSGGMYTQKLDVGTLKTGGSASKPFDGVVTYAQCKRAQVILAHELASRWSDDDSVFASMHPGWVDTTGVQTSLPGFHKVTKSFLRSPDQGADTIVWLASSPDAETVNGEFYFDRMVRREHMALRNTASPREDIDALWELVQGAVADFL